jgi:predicted secreted protein
MKRALTIGAVVVCAAAFATVASAASGKTVTPSDTGRTVTLAPGGRLIISLKDNNPSTGYSWSYARRASRQVLVLVSDHTAAPTGAMGYAGAPAPRTIVYRARAKGTTHLRLVYLPPGRSTKPAATLALTVRVR